MRRLILLLFFVLQNSISFAQQVGNIGEQKIKLFLNNPKNCDSVENKKADYHHQNISFVFFAQNAFIKETYYYTKYKLKD